MRQQAATLLRRCADRLDPPRPRVTADYRVATAKAAVVLAEERLAQARRKYAASVR